MNIESVGVSDAVHLSYKSNSLLGEGARWCAKTHSLYWVDILGCKLHRWNPRTAENTTWTLPKRVGSSACIDDRTRLLALEDGLYAIDLITSEVKVLQTLEHPTETHRLNDGYLDPVGRFWVGSMNESGAFDGRLYCFHDFHRPPELHGTHWGCPNGMGWSPRGDVMYVTDSRERTIWAYDYHVATGSIAGQRVFARFDTGVPDGLTVDKDGNIWSALWDAWAVVGISPEGKWLRNIPVPVKRPTSVAFGGDDGQTLFITSASVNVPLFDQLSPPLDGSIFNIHLIQGGPAEVRWADCHHSD